MKDDMDSMLDEIVERVESLKFAFGDYKRGMRAKLATQRELIELLRRQRDGFEEGYNSISKELKELKGEA